jgi:hypothetical protein
VGGRVVTSKSPKADGPPHRLAGRCRAARKASFQESYLDLHRSEVSFSEDVDFRFPPQSMATASAVACFRISVSRVDFGPRSTRFTESAACS